jgi:general secretion pathway protein A
MYETFFGFKEKPFSIIPDPSFLYPSSKHRAALDLLEYGMMNQAGFNVITGEIGTGKTTLIRHILNRMNRDVTVGLISNTHKSFGELLQWILYAYGLDYKGKEKVEMFQAFMEFLINEYANNRRTVLIVDEAQNMSPETLEELRMLSNVNADKSQVLQVVLVGQPQLRETLSSPELEQFAQRIAVDYHLWPLSKEETRGYIRHRILYAGGINPELFNDAACDVVYAQTNGTPRLINLLCDTVLVYAYAVQRPTVDAKLVEEAARDKQKGGLFQRPQKSIKAV